MASTAMGGFRDDEILDRLDLDLGLECQYCHELRHKTLDCPIRPCRLCRKIGSGHFPQDCAHNLEKWSKNTSSTSAPSKPGIQHMFKPPSHSTAATNDDVKNSSSSALSVNDVVEIGTSDLMADWGPVLVTVVLFVVLTLGLLFQLPGRNRVVEFGNMQTSGASILVHAVIFFGLVTIFLIAIGVHVYAG
ncbi:hypothetical protein RJ639_022079 [Escallonia herrerae]|uniref:Uncharacterized protein n=1 Tax=Escallonia herrerae TaxID=1293975 RepID=A0AA88V598_9ASTE|nr:hypothetical protein RJ639_022079 [Escallonia herrerae]